MLAEYCQKSKEKLSKKTLERYQNLSEEEKKSANLLASNIKIFLIKKKKKSVNPVVNDIKISVNLCHKNTGFFEILLFASGYYAG